MLVGKQRGCSEDECTL